MNKIVLYTKTYSRDLSRLLNLINSVKKFNRDNIPFYVSVPESELNLFKNKIDIQYIHLVSDDEIYNTLTQTWHSQQIIKSNFWKLGTCHNYVCIDSDSYFIRPFYISDFMYDDTTPYTVMHQQKDLFNWSSANKMKLGFNPKDGFQNDRKEIMNIFNRTGNFYDFGPSPIIWSRKVWESLDEEYLKKNNLTFEMLILHTPSEFTWYGEWLMTKKIINIIPIEPMFKVFHYREQYDYYKKNNYTLEDLTENYLGIVMQSNWSDTLVY